MLCKSLSWIFWDSSLTAAGLAAMMLGSLASIGLALDEAADWLLETVTELALLVPAEVGSALEAGAVVCARELLLNVNKITKQNKVYLWKKQSTDCSICWPMSPSDWKRENWPAWDHRRSFAAVVGTWGPGDHQGLPSRPRMRWRVRQWRFADPPDLPRTKKSLPPVDCSTSRSICAKFSRPSLCRTPI